MCNPSVYAVLLTDAPQAHFVFIAINLLIQLCYCNRPPDNKSFLLCKTNTYTHYTSLSTKLGRRRRVRLPSHLRNGHMQPRTNSAEQKLPSLGKMQQTLAVSPPQEREREQKQASMGVKNMYLNTKSILCKFSH